MHKNSQQRVQLYLLLATAVSVFFWVVSRYPALLKKLAKGTTQVHQAWAFDLLSKEHLDAGIMERVGGNFFNWCYTNWKGMTYGILVATILLPMFQHLRTMRFQNPWLRTLFGVGMGVPLGLCANCATPVSLGLKKGGVGTETAVSTLMASPTLNVTCLIMAFTMLPLSFAGMKVGATLLVLTTVPFLTRLTTKPESEQPLDIACDVPAPESWAERLRGVLRELEIGRAHV